MNYVVPENFVPEFTKRFDEDGFIVEVMFVGNFLEDLGDGINPNGSWWFKLYNLHGDLCATGPYKWPNGGLTLENVANHIASFYHGANLQPLEDEPMSPEEIESFDPHLRALVLVQSLYFEPNPREDLEVIWFHAHGNDWSCFVKSKTDTDDRLFELTYDSKDKDTYVCVYRFDAQASKLVSGDFVIHTKN